MSQRPTRHLSVADAVALHAAAMALDQSNPSPLRGGGMGLLESALLRAQTAEYYEQADHVRQAVLLAIGISQNQPFVDGNKRTGFFAALTFLIANGWEIDPAAIEPFADRLIQVAERSAEWEPAAGEFEQWLRPWLRQRT